MEDAAWSTEFLCLKYRLLTKVNTETSGKVFETNHI